jgi:hypothetical protein
MASGFFPPNDNTSVPVQPTPKAVGTPGYFTDGNLILAATNVDCDFLNGLVNEFSTLAAAGGVALSPSSPNMVTNIKNLITQQGSLYVKIAGSTMTGNLITGQNYAANSAVSALSVQNGTYNLSILPRSTTVSVNPIVVAGDTVLSFTTGTINTGALVIAPWASGTAGGLRIDSAGNVTASENLSSQQAFFLQNGNSNRWGFAYTGTESGSNAGSNLQLISYADAGTSLGVPLSIARSTGVVSFSASPTIPTQALSDNSSSAVNSAWVKGQAYAPIASPTFTGTVTVPTPGASDNTTKAANTEWVQACFLPVFNPVIQGTAIVGTPPYLDNTSRPPNTAWVNAYFASLTSPAFTGTPSCATPGFVNNGQMINTNWLFTYFANFCANQSGTWGSSWMRFPSFLFGGTAPIIVQFGVGGYYGYSQGYNTVNFNITFPNTALCVVASIGYNHGGSVIGGQLNGSTSSFTVGWGMNGNTTTYASGECYYWMAIGY